MSVLSVLNLNKKIIQGEQVRTVLDGVTFELGQGEILSIVGRSGSGKSTLLQCVAGLVGYDQGTISIENEVVPAGNDEVCSQLRLRKIGVVFQFFNLLPALTLAQNIALPARLAGMSTVEATKKARKLGAQMGIEYCLDQLPGTVSGGEAQRTAIARALINDPVLLLADEPTGNLDEESAAGILSVLTEAVNSAGCGMLLVSHDAETVRIADRVLTLHDGRLDEVGSSGPEGAPVGESL